MGEVSERPGPGDDIEHPRVEGLAVDLAARISGLARPEQVLMSAAVADSARQRLDATAFERPIRWQAYGPYSLKGFDERREIREAGLEGIAPFDTPAASEKARPATPDRAAAAKRATLRLGSIAVTVVATVADDGVISRARFADVEGHAPESLAAYECVLLAQASGRQGHLRPERERVRGCLERAVRDDPSYTDAWAELAFLDVAEHMFPQTGSPDALARALRAAQRAVEADPTHERALLVLGAAHFFRHELDRAYAEFERAIALNPNNTWVLTWVAGGYIFAGEGERGMTLVRRAAALDPQHPTWRHHRVAAYRFQREEYAEALAAARNAFQGEFWTHLYVAASYGQLGRADEAGPAVAELLSLYPGFTLRTASEELRKWNFPDDLIERYLMGLRKAGVAEEPRE